MPQRYKKEIIQTNNLPKKEKIQRNNFPKNEKIQGYSYRNSGEEGLDELPDGTEVRPMTFAVIVKKAQRKDNDGYTDDGTGKSAQQHRQVFADGVVFPDKSVPLFIEPHTWLGVVLSSDYPTHSFATIGVLTISRQIETLGDMETIVQVELVGHLLEGPAMTTTAISAIEGQIIMYHLVTHDIDKLFLSKVVVVGHGDNWVINVLIEPAALVILEIAAGILGGCQNIEIRSGKFPSEVLRVTLLENLRHIENIGYHPVLS